MKKFLIPVSVAAVCPAVIGTVKAAEEPPKVPERTEGKCHIGPLKIKPSELPMYDHADPPCITKEERSKSDLEEAVSVVRKELWVYVDDLDRYKEKMVEYVETGKAYSGFIISYLKEENNYLPRAGAIGLGGLTGLVLGLRGGFIRRLLYGSTGAVAMASLCYPNEAAVYSKEALQNAKKYALIGYNFINGVKPESKAVVSEPHAEKRETTSNTQNQAPKDAQKAPKPMVNTSSTTPACSTEEVDASKEKFIETLPLTTISNSLTSRLVTSCPIPPEDLRGKHLKNTPPPVVESLTKLIHYQSFPGSSPPASCSFLPSNEQSGKK